MTTIASWNVNSIKARLPIVLDWLDTHKPDILLLQELKCVEDDFPKDDIEKLGYHCAVSGQKTYNGVALITKDEPKDVITALPGDKKDEQARYVEATVNGIRVASIYLPNGNPVGTEKFDYKINWMKRLQSHAKKLLTKHQPVVLGGDYNVIPTDDMDVWDPRAMKDDALAQPESRARFRALQHLGLTDAFRALHPDEAGAYTFWDYQARAWPQDHGFRIDHFLLSPEAADKLKKCWIDKEPRGREKASDHTPILIELA